MSLYLGDNLISNSISVPYNWSGTLAEYANLPEIHEDWIYCITDDVPPTTEIYSKTEVNTLLNGKAGTDLSNLSATGRKAFLNKQQITNCILEDPQKIILSLNNGTLTLHAGSVVCVPNGFEADGVTPKFDEVTIASDLTVSGTTTDVGTIRYIYYRANGITSSLRTLSGPTPTPSATYTMVYNTTTNKIGRCTSSTTVDYSELMSFPICIVLSDGTYLMGSIDQTFQSIGYIGSTVFVRKGLKVLIPNGRNADGSLKNVEVVNNNVIVRTFETNNNQTGHIGFNSNQAEYKIGFMNYSNQKYDEMNNYVMNLDTNTRWDRAFIGSMTTTNGVISNFKPYSAANILKYSDSSQISGWSMPSSRYIDLTLGASGSTYIAPANGWVYIRKNSGASGTFMYIKNISVGNTEFTNSSAAYTFDYNLYMPVKKGDIYEIGYTFSGATRNFRFFYAEGEQ